MQNKNRLNKSTTAAGSQYDSNRPAASNAAQLKIADIMSRYVISISADSSAGSAVSIMARNNVSCLIVLDDAAPVGIITESDILDKVAAKNKNFEKTKISRIMSGHLTTVTSDTSVAEAVSIIQSENIKRLPVLDKNRLIGIATLTDLLKSVTAFGIHKNVSQIMTSEIATADKDLSVVNIARLMSEKDTCCIIAVDKNKPVGTLTKLQLLRKMVELDQDLNQTKLQDIMASPVKSITPDCSVFNAQKMMEKSHNRRLVVIDGKKICGIVTRTDILTVAENELREKQSSLQWLQNTKCPAFIVDVDGNITAVNPHFIKLLEESDPDAFIGKPALPKCFWNNQNDLAEFANQLNTKSADIKQLTLKTATGKKITVLAFTCFIPDRSVGSGFTLVTFYETTDSQSKINPKQTDPPKQKVVSDQAKGEFLAGMSHKIRTSVNAIIGFSDVLISQDINAEQTQYVHIIKESSENLLKLINDIVDLSKIESGKLEPEIIDCSLEQILASVEALMRPPAKQKGIRFEVLQCGELPSQIRTDPERLRQCLINLIDNSIKFTEKGYVYVNVSMLSENNTPYISFDIEDTGVGIHDEKQQDIFDIYAQVDKTAANSKSHSGLGLAITKQLALLLGAELSVKSKLNKGSVFSLKLPVGLDVESQPQLDKYHFINDFDQEPEESGNEKYAGRVLIAEDSRTNQILINLLLMKMGVDVVIVEDGKEAVQKALNEEPFDIILMDVQMPHMDGLEATRTLRAKGYKTPIVALTAHVTEDAEQKCLSAGCDEYISKPLSQNSLSKILSKYLQTNGTTIAEKVDSVRSQVDQLGQLCMEVSPMDKKVEPQKTGSNVTNIIDWNYLLDLCDDESIIKETVAMFLKDSPKCIHSITGAVESENSKYVKLYAHSLKGAALSVGARELSQKAYALELAAQEKNIKAFAALFEEVHSEFDKLALFLASPDWPQQLKSNLAARRKK